MSRLLVIVAVLVVVVVGGMFVLAGQAKEKPQTRIEKVIPVETLTK